MLGFVRENHGLFLSEIKRHKTKNEFERLMLIDNSLKFLEDSITKYEMEKMNHLVIILSESMSNLLLNIVNSYEEYIKVAKNNVKDISNINSDTNELNSEIAFMNTALLQVEHNVDGVHGTKLVSYEKEKEALQEEALNLSRSFKDNTENIDKEIFTKARKLKRDINLLVEETKGTAFEIFFIKEVIMILNKYRGEDDAFDLMIVSLEESYQNEKFNASIFKAKEIIEMYGIKE